MGPGAERGDPLERLTLPIVVASYEERFTSCVNTGSREILTQSDRPKNLKPATACSVLLPKPALWPALKIYPSLHQPPHHLRKPLRKRIGYPHARDLPPVLQIFRHEQAAVGLQCGGEH